MNSNNSNSKNSNSDNPSIPNKLNDSVKYELPSETDSTINQNNIISNLISNNTNNNLLNNIKSQEFIVFNGKKKNKKNKNKKQLQNQMKEEYETYIESLDLFSQEPNLSKENLLLPKSNSNLSLVIKSPSKFFYKSQNYYCHNVCVAEVFHLL